MPLHQVLPIVIVFAELLLYDGIIVELCMLTFDLFPVEITDGHGVATNHFCSTFMVLR